MGSTSELTGFLVGQPWWVDLIAVLIAVSGWVVTKLVRRSGDTGYGREALDRADSARDILADVALDERNKTRALDIAMHEVGDALGLADTATTAQIIEAARDHRCCQPPATLFDPSGENPNDKS